MKKILASLAVLTAMAGASALPASAQTETAEVYVTIADAEGALAMAQESVTVTDTDSDGKLTINDALYLAHESAYSGGASAGYGTAETEYGLSLTKLWGAENGGSYGYYVNNASAMSLVDEIKSGDYINAFVYTDLTAWSDTYCFFNVNEITADEDTSFELTLSAAGYDANWNPITLPVEGAVITVGDKATEYITDSEGKAVLTVADAGEYIISAKSDTQTLVPPVCKAKINAVVETTTTVATTTAQTTTTATAKTTTTTKASAVSPSTGDGRVSTALLACGVACFVSVAALSAKKKDE